MNELYRVTPYEFESTADPQQVTLTYGQNIQSPKPGLETPETMDLVPAIANLLLEMRKIGPETSSEPIQE